jgi:ferric-dicitrate binding protein FerR (iron transport regulator)
VAPDANDVWDDQIARLLAGYRDPAIDTANLAETGRTLARRLHEDGLLDANLGALVPRVEEPDVDAERLRGIGEGLAEALRQRPARSFRPRPLRRAPAAEGTWGWAAAAAAAALLILFSALSSPSRPDRPTPAPVALPSAPRPEPTIPAPPPERPPHRPEEPRTVATAPEPQRSAPPPETPAPSPDPAPPPAPAPAPAPTVVAPPLVEVARLDRIEGTVEVAEGGERRAAVAGQALPALAVLETAKGARGRVTYADGTALELGPESTLQLLAPPTGAKELSLRRGTTGAKVAPQPAGKPFVLLTPQAEVRVLGTRFTVSAEAQSSRLEVREGKVRFTRRADGAAVEVAAGQFAVASRGVAMLTRPLPEEAKTVFFEVEEFGSARGTRPADGMVRRIFLEPFDSAAGGWCVAAPAAGMEIAGDLKLAKGAWYVWVRYRDEPGNSKISFTLLLGEQAAGQASTPGRDRGWVWKRFPIAWGGGTARITLRSTSDGMKATPAQADFRQSPYAALNRWDRLCVTPDESFVPE